MSVFVRRIDCLLLDHLLQHIDSVCKYHRIRNRIFDNENKHKKHANRACFHA